ncbi:MAG: hypothetical protein AAF581_06910 [Planctomycetota bacterium]
MRGTVVIMLLVGLLVGFGASEFLRSVDEGTPDLELVAHDDFDDLQERSIDWIDADAAVPASGPAAASLTQALAALPQPDVGPAMGDLWGVAFDENGRPVGGLEIRLQATGVAPGGAAIVIEENSLEEYIRRRVSRHRYHHDITTSVVTDAQGRFRCASLPRNAYRIEAASATSGYALKVTVDGAQRQTAYPGQEVVIVASQRRRLAVDVRRADGTQVASATLEDGKYGRYPWKAESPTVLIPPHTAVLKAVLEDGPESGVTPVPRGSSRTPMKLTVLPVLSLAVTPQAPPGTELDEVMVYVLASEPGQEPVIDELLALGLKREGDPGSSAYYSDLTPGYYWVGVGLLAGRIDVATSVEVVQDEETVELQLPAPTSDDGLLVAAYAPTGEILPRQHWSLSKVEDWETLDVKAIHLGDGWTRLVTATDLTSAFDGKHEMQLQLWNGEYGNRIVSVESREVVVRYAPRGTLQIQVVSSSSLPPTLRLQLASAERSGAHIERVDGESAFIATAESGDYELVATIKGNAIHREPVTVPAGSGVHRLELPSFHRVVFRDIGDPFLVLYGDGGRRRLMASVSGSEAVFEGVPAGSYVALNDQGLMEVEIAADRTLGFSPVAINALEVSADPDVVIPGSLRDGDLIIGANGKEFADTTALQILFMPMRQGKPIAMTILRGNEELTIDFDAETATQLWKLMSREQVRALPKHRG